MRNHLPTLAALVALSSLTPACGLLNITDGGSTQRHSRPLAQLETIEGEVVVLGLPEEEPGASEYEQGIRDEQGRVWSILQNEKGLALRSDAEYRGRPVRVRAWTFPRANYLDVYDLQVLDESSDGVEEPVWEAERLGDRETLAGTIVCIGCELKEADGGGAQSQCNLFADHEHGLRLDDGTILSLLGDPSGRHGGKGWDLRHNPLYLGKSTRVSGRRIAGTKLFVVEDVRLLPGD